MMYTHTGIDVLPLDFESAHAGRGNKNTNSVRGTLKSVPVAGVMAVRGECCKGGLRHWFPCVSIDSNKGVGKAAKPVVCKYEKHSKF